MHNRGRTHVSLFFALFTPLLPGCGQQKSYAEMLVFPLSEVDLVLKFDEITEKRCRGTAALSGSDYVVQEGFDCSSETVTSERTLEIRLTQEPVGPVSRLLSHIRIYQGRDQRIVHANERKKSGAAGRRVAASAMPQTEPARLQWELRRGRTAANAAVEEERSSQGE